MSQVARIGDIGVGTCPCHDGGKPYTTVFISGASTVFADGLQVAILGTVGVSSCGHSTIALSAASFVDANGIKVHRLGDVGANCGNYVTITASADVDAL